MHVQQVQLKPLSGIELTANENVILKWIRSAQWQPQTGGNEPIPYKAKVPEFYSGVRLFNVQGGGAMGPLDLFIKKISYQGVISKQDLYPVITEGGARFLLLRKADLDNLGAGGGADDEYGEE